MNAEQFEQAIQNKTGPPSKGKNAEQASQGDRKNNILTQILDQNARGRLNNIGAVDPNKLNQIESYLIKMAQSGQINGKLTEPALVRILDQISALNNSKKGPTVTYTRLRVFGSDEESDW